MKVRSGFVSNSSSSSFIIFGKEIKTEADLKKAENPIMIGDYLYEGRDVIEVTNPMIKSIVDKGLLYSKTFIDAFKKIDGDSSITVDKTELPDKFQIFSVEQDYCCTSTLEEFKERYCNNEN